MSDSTALRDFTLSDEDVYPLEWTLGVTTGAALAPRAFPSIDIHPQSQRRHSPTIRFYGAYSNRAPIIQTVEALYALVDIAEGWNSYGARAVRRDVIDLVVAWIPQLLQTSTPPPTVVPTSDGGIQLEWHRKGVDLEIYFDSNENARFLAEDLTTAESVESPAVGHEEVLRDWIVRISD